MLKYRLLLVALLPFFFAAGCSNQSTVVIPTETPAPTSTPSPAPTATLTPNQVAAACGAQFAQLANKGSFGHVGDLIFSHPQLGFLSYPGIFLPDDIPVNKPFQIDTAPGPRIHANPGMGGYGSGFTFDICNSSTNASHTLQALGMKISTSAPDISTNINAEVGCDSPFDSKTRVGGMGGCGGSMGPCEDCYLFYTTWPAGIAVNTQGTVKQVVGDYSSVGSTTPSNTPLPATLKAGAVATIWMGMDYPASPGTFTFDFGATVDSNAIAFAGSASEPIFLAKNAHKWSGLYCQVTASMNAQIPSTGVDHTYVCPQGS